MKKKLSLQQLKVTSFATDFEQKDAQTVKGGTYVSRRNCTQNTEYFKCSALYCYTDISCPVPDEEEQF